MSPSRGGRSNDRDCAKRCLVPLRLANAAEAQATRDRLSSALRAVRARRSQGGVCNDCLLTADGYAANRVERTRLGKRGSARTGGPAGNRYRDRRESSRPQAFPGRHGSEGTAPGSLKQADRRGDVSDHVVEIVIVPVPGEPGRIRRGRICQRRQHQHRRRQHENPQSRPGALPHRELDSS